MEKRRSECARERGYIAGKWLQVLFLNYNRKSKGGRVYDNRLRLIVPCVRRNETRDEVHSFHSPSRRPLRSPLQKRMDDGFCATAHADSCLPHSLPRFSLTHRLSYSSSSRSHCECVLLQNKLPSRERKKREEREREKIRMMNACQKCRQKVRLGSHFSPSLLFGCACSADAAALSSALLPLLSHPGAASSPDQLVCFIISQNCLSNFAAK